MAEFDTIIRMSPITLHLAPETEARLDRLAESRHRSQDEIARTAIEQYLEREENSQEKHYPRRTPVGGIITPV